MINRGSNHNRLRRAGIVTGVVAAIGLSTALVPPVAAHAEAKNACSGVTKCTIVANVDVTGDGKADSVGIATLKRDATYAYRYQVRVRGAGGTVLTVTDNNAAWDRKHIFFGATNIDGRPGLDLVVGHLEGAHTGFYHVLGYHNRKLVVLNAPTLPKKAGPLSDDGSWVTDGAVSSFAGVRRKTTNGHRTLIESFGSRNPDAAVYWGWQVKYRWSDGAWKLISSTHRSFTDAQASTLWGWHVKGLPR